MQNITSPKPKPAYTCFECDGPLNGPTCPAYNPADEAKRAPRVTVEELEEIIEDNTYRGAANKILDIIDRIQAEPPAMGWRMSPLIATPDMIVAWAEAAAWGDLSDTYAAMINAAPPAPSEGE